MGRTVINQTENKQTIILNDSPEGVEGGYFDNLMEWHEFGGGGGNDRTFFFNTITNSAESNTAINIAQCMTTSATGITPVYWTEMGSTLSAGKSTTTPIVSLVGDLSSKEFSGIILLKHDRLEVSGPAELYEIQTDVYFIKPTADGEITIIVKGEI